MLILTVMLAMAAHDPVPPAAMSGPPAPETVQYAESRPPMIGLEGPELDACGGVGRIGGFPDGITLLEAPEEGARKGEELPHRTLVWLCEAQGAWQGVVYASGDFQELGDCRVSSPVAEPEPYDGPCKYGWLKARQIQLLVG